MVHRILFIGDGVPQPSRHGWPERLCEAARTDGWEVAPLSLGMTGETSLVLPGRWNDALSHATPRAAAVFAFGNADMAESWPLAAGDGAVPSIHVPLIDSLRAAEQVLRAASRSLPVLWVGPCPVLTRDLAETGGRLNAGLSYRNDWTAALNAAFAHLSRELDVPYLDLFTPLWQRTEWFDSLRRGADGAHPDETGQGMIADLVGGWWAWHALVAGGRLPFPPSRPH